MTKRHIYRILKSCQKRKKHSKTPFTQVITEKSVIYCTSKKRCRMNTKCIHCTAINYPIATVCFNCGRPPFAHQQPVTVTTLDPNSPEIRAELRQYNSFYSGRCLECGYIGSMGVVRTATEKLPWYLSWGIIIPFIFCPIGWFLLGFRIVSGWSRTTSVVNTRCPACRKILAFN